MQIPQLTTEPGQSHIVEGSRSPWGTVESVEVLANGLHRIDTAGHGGYHLSPARNQLIHPAIRNSSGFYEEDTEEAIVRLYYPAETVLSGSVEENFALAYVKIRENYPYAFELITGIKVTGAESPTLAESQYKEAHNGDWIGRASRGDYDDEHLVIEAYHINYPEKRLFKVLKAEWESTEVDLMYKAMVIDPDRHQPLRSPSES